MNELVPGARYEGELTLDGQDVHDPALDVVALRQRVGMVFQQWNPFPRSVRDNVAYGPRLTSRLDPREEGALVEEALRRAALWDEVKDRLEQSALTLSGGQQQRLCIARALANRPEVLLLDEPTSALDPVATRKIEELLYALKRDLTIILVTHNLQQAARASDVTAFLDGGRLVEMDASSVLFTRPADARTEAYITGRFG
jgi:phosphate transport system ATP-binding protein